MHGRRIWTLIPESYDVKSEAKCLWYGQNCRCSKSNGKKNTTRAARVAFPAVSFVATVVAFTAAKYGIPPQNTAVLSGNVTQSSKTKKNAPHRISMRMTSRYYLWTPSTV